MLQRIEFSVTKILSSWFLSLTAGVIYLWGEKRSLENTCLHIGVVNLKGWVSCMLYLAFCVHTGIVNLKGWVSCMLYFVRTPGLRKASSAGRGLNRVHVFISRTVIKPTTCVPVSLHFPNAAHFRIWGVWLGICTQLLKSQRVTVQWGLQIQQLLTVLETYIMADTCTYSHTHTHIWHTCILARRCMNAHAHTEKAKLRVCSIGTLTIS